MIATTQKTKPPTLTNHPAIIVTVVSYISSTHLLTLADTPTQTQSHTHTTQFGTKQIRLAYSLKNSERAKSRLPNHPQTTRHCVQSSYYYYNNITDAHKH